MCFIREVRISGAQWAANAPAWGQPMADVDWMMLRVQACSGHLFAAPLGAGDDVRSPAWVDLGPMDDLPNPRRSLGCLVWAAWLEQVGWG